jgi:translocation and assembly module TamB
VQLTLRTARLRAQGVLDGPDGRLQIELDAPRLGDLDSQLQGALQAQATLSGNWRRPDVELEAQATDLRAFGQAASSISVQAHTRKGLDGEFQVHAALGEFRSSPEAPVWLQAAELQVQGLVGDHSIALRSTLAGGRTMMLRAQGALADRRWRGLLAQAQLDGPQKASLSEPAPLEVDATRLQLGPARLQALGATVQLDHLELGSQRLVTHGHFEGLHLPEAGSTMLPSVDSATDPLLLRGRWNLTLGQRADGEFDIERQSGDLRPSFELAAAPALGLRELSAKVRLDDGQLQVQANLDSERGGNLTAVAQAVVQRDPAGHWRLAQQQPWHIDASAHLAAIEAFNPLFSQRVRANVRLAGRLAATLRIAGTPQNPEASGTIEGDGLRLAWIDQGVRLEAGRLRCRVNGDQIDVDEVHFEGPLRVPPADRRPRDAIRGQEPGFVTASGRLRLSDLGGSLQVRAQRLPLLQRPDRWLVASGGGNVEFAQHRVQLNGAVVADAGFLDLNRPDLPTLSDDVRVTASGGSAATATEPKVAIGFDLSIDLGPAFFLRGSGLDARVTGPLRLRGEGHGAVRTTGAIAMEEGTYEGFGQRLSIRYGHINFQGAADNPNLDVLAVRTDLPVEVGARVTGSVARPIVRLHSDPPLSDYEALSWLALGRPPGDARTDNIALARLAAGLLSGSGEGIPTRLARSIGIDEVNVRSGDVASSATLLPRQSVAGKLHGDDTTAATANVASQIISIGHRVNDAITVSYEQAVTGASNVVQISYQLSRRLSLIGRAGSENALDLVFSLSFD